MQEGQLLRIWKDERPSDKTVCLSALLFQEPRPTNWKQTLGPLNLEFESTDQVKKADVHGPRLPFEDDFCQGPGTERITRSYCDI